MSKKQLPVPGKYYINLTGQLIKVRCVLYSDSELAVVRLEYQDGHQLTVMIDEWNWLDLRPYADWFLGDPESSSELEG
ncbi:MAG: hypothetical protein GXP13_03675 [Gammaproteobacteria bacterium]|nr:hypothetical protein [Gammaproteobacteria bacterium]